jgi:hypothetical protein
MRLRHFRGRKVHSPFVYGVVRECLMPTEGRPTDEQIEALRQYLERHPLYDGEAVFVPCRRGGLRTRRKDRRERRELVAGHGGTSFETRKFLCLLTAERLPKQHFKL